MKNVPEIIRQAFDNIDNAFMESIAQNEHDAILKELAKMVICGAMDSKLVEECAEFLEEG